MGRSERPLDGSGTPTVVFAAELRLLREQAGNPTYLKMHRASGKVRSKTALSEAAGGDHLPTWETVEAYVSALGADPAHWRPRWEEAQEQERRRGEGGAVVARAPGEQHGALPNSANTSRPPRFVKPNPSKRSMAIAAVTISVVAVTFISLVTRLGRVTAASGPAAVVVQNKVAIGSSALIEASTPVYLSSKTMPYCAERGCEVSGTDMWSGADIAVVCQKFGSWMTNADLASKGIAENPGRASSTVWYRAVFPNGKTGYISAVWLKAPYRGGMRLPHCR
jgi:hypothetical protein